MIQMITSTMKLEISSESKHPVYRQIADQVHFAVNTGSLNPGDKLPSLRDVATAHGLAVNTVAKAYRELAAKGVVVVRDRSAYEVAKPKGKAGAHAAKAKADFGPSGRYAARGVSASKTEVHAAVDKLDQGVFPGSFCKLTEDYLTGDPDLCNVIHADGSGTKSILGYLHYRETGDPSVFAGIAQDSIVMNIDDLLCIGATNRILLSSTVNRNARQFPAEALAALIEGTEAFLAKLRGLGVDIHSGGGETADVGDLTGTVTVDSCAVAVMRKADVITGANIKPGLAIIGIASGGTCDYEEGENSGIGSNGLTSARHDLLSPYYRKKFPETYDPNTPKKLVYCGPYRMKDKLPGSSLTVGQALLSPTRTYAPVVTEILRQKRSAVKGIVHCSGGGQTKCLRFGNGVHFIKDRLMKPPPIFRAIQKASGTTPKEMYQVYNMGHRLEVYCKPADTKALLKIIRGFGLEADIIGQTVKTERKDGGNHLTLMHGKKALKYAL